MTNLFLPVLVLVLVGLQVDRAHAIIDLAQVLELIDTLPHTTRQLLVFPRTRHEPLVLHVQLVAPLVELESLGMHLFERDLLPVQAFDFILQLLGC
jgi:hypothetical protein